MSKQTVPNSFVFQTNFLPAAAWSLRKRKAMLRPCKSYLTSCTRFTQPSVCGYTNHGERYQEEAVALQRLEDFSYQATAAGLSQSPGHAGDTGATCPLLSSGASLLAMGPTYCLPPRHDGWKRALNPYNIIKGSTETLTQRRSKKLCKG